MPHITAQSLRDILADGIAPSIDVHRASKAEHSESAYEPPQGPPTDEEIDDFLFHNPLFDEETLELLTHPGLLGFPAKTANASEDWLSEFREQISAWANNQSWLAGDEPLRLFTPPYTAAECQIWTPPESVPSWVGNAPSYALLAADLLNKGQLLSELPWRYFEELIGALLESEAWTVTVTQGTRDGGIDVIATKEDSVLGTLRSVWQAKKYKASNKVKLHEVRELSAIRDDNKATKAFVVTTSSLTRDAIAWVKRDLYRLGYKEHDQIKKWLEVAYLK